MHQRFLVITVNDVPDAYIHSQHAERSAAVESFRALAARQYGTDYSDLVADAEEMEVSQGELEVDRVFFSWADTHCGTGLVTQDLSSLVEPLLLLAEKLCGNRAEAESLCALLLSDSEENRSQGRALVETLSKE